MVVEQTDHGTWMSGKQPWQADVHTDRYTGIYTYRQAGGHTSMQRDKQADRQIGRQAGRQTDRQKHDIHSFQESVERPFKKTYSEALPDQPRHYKLDFSQL